MTFSPIRSMTGFAAVEIMAEDMVLAFEIRTLNARFLELTLQLPEELRQLESQVRESIHKHLRRGRVQVRLGLSPSHQGHHFKLNWPLLEQVVGAANELTQRFGPLEPLSAAQLLSWPGAMDRHAGLSPSQWKPWVEQILTRGLGELDRSRQAEGARLRQVLLETTDHMEQLITQVQTRLPLFLAASRERLLNQLAEAGVGAWEDRMRQELLLLLTKLDVKEELARLASHLSEVRNILAVGDQAGKRLDFLAQEINREVNTLGAKSPDDVVAHLVVELKLAVEQLREQVQNLE